MLMKFENLVVALHIPIKSEEFALQALNVSIVAIQ